MYLIVTFDEKPGFLAHIKKITVKSFVANKDMGSCLEYSEGYQKIITEQGINHAYIKRHQWMQSDGIYGILAENDGHVIGGVILFIPVDKFSFPYEDVTNFSNKSKKKTPFIHQEGTGELFALWHANQVAGWGLSYILLKAGLALSIKLGLKKTLYLSADFNLRLIDKLGFEPELENDVPITYVLQQASIKTVITLNSFCSDNEFVARQQKIDIIELAKSGVSVKLESVLGKNLEVEYHI